MTGAWKHFSAAAAAAATALLLLPGVISQDLIETCEDLQAAFELTNTQDVEVLVDSNQDIDCETFTNMTMTSNSLTVSSDGGGGSVSLTNVRFDITNGARLTWGPRASFGFIEDDEQNNDGGAIFIGEGSNVIFLDELTVSDATITNVRDDDSDSASFQRFGGCVWTNGRFRVDGPSRFRRCEIVGAGESSPGGGGGIYVGPEGSVLLDGGVEMTEIFITDDGGGEGGAIFNLGTVNIRANARFESISSVGAIYNAEGGRFTFRNNAQALFRDCSNGDSEGSALINVGEFTFAGPALFIDNDAPVIVAVGSSDTTISRESAFWAIERFGFGGAAGDFASDMGPAFAIGDGVEILIPNNVRIVGYDDAGF